MSYGTEMAPFPAVEMRILSPAQGFRGGLKKIANSVSPSNDILTRSNTFLERDTGQEILSVSHPKRNKGNGVTHHVFRILVVRLSFPEQF